MKKPATGIEAIAVKRATLADSDKVRYRVYRSEGDFVAVIAESALMAMKVSGIMTPHRIVRDLPNEGIAIEAQRMSKVSDSEPRVNLATKQTRTDGARMNTEMADNTLPVESGFVAMQVKDFQRKTVPWARILTPEMVEQAQAKSKPTAPAAPFPVPVMQEPLPAAPPPEPESAPVKEAAPPLKASTRQEPAPAAEPDVLSEEEVQKLLNG